MSPADAAFISNIRADFAAGADLVIACGAVALFPEDIVGKSDDELLAYVAGRLAKKPKPKEIPCPA